MRFTHRGATTRKCSNPQITARMALRTAGGRFFYFQRNVLKVSIQTLGFVRFKTSCPVEVSRLDHLVLTVKSVPDTINFYTSLSHITCSLCVFKGDRKALGFGQQKFNLHQLGQEFEPKAKHPTSGSADLCLITKTPLATVASHLKVCGVEIEEGPVERSGAALIGQRVTPVTVESVTASLQNFSLNKCNLDLPIHAVEISRVVMGMLHANMTQQSEEVWADQSSRSEGLHGHFAIQEGAASVELEGVACLMLRFGEWPVDDVLDLRWGDSARAQPHEKLMDRGGSICYPVHPQMGREALEAHVLLL
ncbi:hypothetical protein F7725_009948 [Dissostichus mawsoni]|uniref:Uncharacterized protein n=1 Tax=Dissostichus mawsoni TaxID=36200 RepID=A0A7J5XMF6_DISMA|nr:hypothetical protein F7725_009948 [Dissostichus mawsoni]